MCNKAIFSYVYADGRRVDEVQQELCDESRHGQPCKLTKTYQHPTEYLRPGQLNPTPSYGFSQFPPTPPMSSHSGSTSDSERSSKSRRSVYVSGEKVVDLNRRPSRREKGERTIYVESPSLSRAPARKYSVSHSPVSSVRDRDLGSPESRHRSTSGERDRSSSTSSRHGRSIEVKVINEPRRDEHRRNGSKTSSQGDHDDDDERKERRRSSHVRFEDDEKQRQIQSKIEQANEAIANRPVILPTTKALPAPSRYRRGSVVVERSNTALVAAMDHLSLDRERRRNEKRAADIRQKEEEAQRQRLRDRMAPERMAPRRRATVSQDPGRQMIQFNDAPYYVR
ncbi:hypothetical protein GGS23DRAFT_503809 [Durotheca rogersii]|uniref:uncharacterized protein n=1 Tax=Durotheca rogersii TaxID=419775 RepID=UPI00221F6D61|nr:uncharacterized protein GGS23DRAFT_503809 [Durotheca rogersii]KAI5853655.1 hypothetical protein GGS23DRAFT_503809 [Durotheca rogersii]